MDAANCIVDRWLRRSRGRCLTPPYPGEPYPAQSNTPVSDISSLFPSDPTKYRFTLEEDRFLEQVERACFQFFWDEASPYTGLVKDRSSGERLGFAKRREHRGDGIRADRSLHRGSSRLGG